MSEIKFRRSALACLIGRRIIQIRENKDMRRGTLQDRSGVTALGKIETGTNEEVTVVELAKIAIALEVPMSALIPTFGEMRRWQPKPEQAKPVSKDEETAEGEEVG